MESTTYFLESYAVWVVNNFSSKDTKIRECTVVVPLYEIATSVQTVVIVASLKNCLFCSV